MHTKFRTLCQLKAQNTQFNSIEKMMENIEIKTEKIEYSRQMQFKR